MPPQILSEALIHWYHSYLTPFTFHDLRHFLALTQAITAKPPSIKVIQPVDHPVKASYYKSMGSQFSINDTEQRLKQLELRVDELLRTLDRIREENRVLRKQQQDYSSERANLIEKNEVAKSRVEAMIHRLKSME